jgi:hypothetical protein
MRNPFNPAARARYRRPSSSFQPAILALEQRIQLSTTTAQPHLLTAVQVAPAIPTLNQKVVSFLAARLNTRIGGGECAHLASEALRAAGAQFITSQSTIGTGADYPNPGDYVWGTFVAQVSATNGHVSQTTTKTPIVPGDIIQYDNAHFSDGSYATHHTSVVQAVNAQGLPSVVYQQNFASKRYETLNPLDLSKLTSGFVRIYQPVARSAVANLYEYSVVNNSSTSQTYSASIGSYVSRTTLTATNTSSSYTNQYFTTAKGSAAPTLKVGNSSITVSDNAAYEIYGSGSAVAIRRINP